MECDKMDKEAACMRACVGAVAHLQRVGHLGVAHDSQLPAGKGTGGRAADQNHTYASTNEGAVGMCARQWVTGVCNGRKLNARLWCVCVCLCTMNFGSHSRKLLPVAASASGRWRVHAGRGVERGERNQPRGCAIVTR